MPPAVVHCVFGALLVLVSAPLVLRRVPMNGVYGILLAGFGLVFRDQAPPPRSPWSAVFTAGRIR